MRKQNAKAYLRSCIANMWQGIFSGFLWATDTVFINTVFINDMILVALPLIMAGIHDFISVFVITIVLGATKNIQNLVIDIRSKGSKLIALAALLGGPIGLSAYILAIYFLGPFLVCVITSLYPAIGTVLANICLGERRKGYQWISLAISITAVILLGISYDSEIQNIWLGLITAIICAVAWGSEAVICSWTLDKYDLHDTSALWIRQVSSTAVSMIIIIFLLASGFSLYTVNDVVFNKMSWLLMAATCGALSYMFYYKSIHRIGASRAMAINSSYSGFAILINVLVWGVVPTYQEIILGLLIVGGGIIAAYDYKG